MKGLVWCDLKASVIGGLAFSSRTAGLECCFAQPRLGPSCQTFANPHPALAWYGLVFKDTCNDAVQPHANVRLVGAPNW